MMKIKQCIVEEKRDVRFATWSAAEVKIILWGAYCVTISTL